MKTVLFIPNYWYQSLELFQEISIALGNNVNKVLLDTGDQYFQSSKGDRYNLDDFNNYYDAVFSLEFPHKHDIKIIQLWRMYQYKIKLNKIISVNKPSLIITTGDRNNFYLIVKKLCPGIPIVIMQGALLHTQYYQI